MRRPCRQARVPRGRCRGRQGGHRGGAAAPVNGRRASGGIARSGAIPPSRFATAARAGRGPPRSARRPPAPAAGRPAAATRGSAPMRVVRRRAQPPRGSAGQQLGLVGGHVDADRAVARAALAGQAQVERLARPRRRASRRAPARPCAASRAAPGPGRGWSPSPRGWPGSDGHITAAGASARHLPDAGAAVHRGETRRRRAGERERRRVARPWAGRRAPAGPRRAARVAPARRG